jgi:hypothetical protein
MVTGFGMGKENYDFGPPGRRSRHVLLPITLSSSGLLGRRLQDRSATMVASVAISGLLMR